MCLIFIALKSHPQYKLIVAANRDEFYDRKTAPAGYWPDHPQILGGRDLEAGGTWLAMNTYGRIGMVTNFRDPKNIRADAPSRGQLVTDFMLTPMSAQAYLESLLPVQAKYNGFNLITGNADELWHMSNYGTRLTRLTEGVFGLSNHLLETPWPKVMRGKERVTGILRAPSISPDDFFNILFDDAIAPDTQLPDTGVGLDRERALSAMFIKSPGYGTRCSTVVLIDQSNKAIFAERVYDPQTFNYTGNSFHFQIQPLEKE
jgi:uncharacterized protein with NRDE domain